MKETKETEALLQDLLNAQSYVWNDAPYQHDLGPDEEETLDFRVRLDPSGKAHLYVGDVCYDDDHRGYCGAGTLGPNDQACDVRDALEAAYDDAEGARDMMNDDDAYWANYKSFPGRYSF